MVAALLLHANCGGVFLPLYGAVLGEAAGLQASTALNQADFAPLESSGGDSSTCWRAFRATAGAVPQGGRHRI
jgi:hypothetical protein